MQFIHNVRQPEGTKIDFNFRMRFTEVNDTTYLHEDDVVAALLEYAALEPDADVRNRLVVLAKAFKG